MLSLTTTYSEKGFGRTCWGSPLWLYTLSAKSCLFLPYRCAASRPGKFARAGLGEWSVVAGKIRGTLPRHHSCLNHWHIHVYSLLSPSYIPRIKTSHPYAGYPPSVTSDIRAGGVHTRSHLRSSRVPLVNLIVPMWAAMSRFQERFVIGATKM